MSRSKLNSKNTLTKTVADVRLWMLAIVNSFSFDINPIQERIDVAKALSKDETLRSIANVLFDSKNETDFETKITPLLTLIASSLPRDKILLRRIYDADEVFKELFEILKTESDKAIRDKKSAVSITLPKGYDKSKHSLESILEASVARDEKGNITSPILFTPIHAIFGDYVSEDVTTDSLK